MNTLRPYNFVEFCEKCGEKNDLYFIYGKKKWINDGPYCIKCRNEGIIEIEPDNDDIEEFIKLYNTGKTPYKIAEITGFNRKIIEKIFKKNNIKLRKRSKNVNKKEVIDLYKSGKSINSISKKLFKDRKTIRQILIRNECI